MSHFQQQACHHMQSLSAARSTLRNWLRRSSWLGGGMSGPWHIASGSVAGEAAGGPEDGRSSHRRALSQHVSYGLSVTLV